MITTRDASSPTQSKAAVIKTAQLHTESSAICPWEDSTAYDRKLLQLNELPVLELDAAAGVALRPLQVVRGHNDRHSRAADAAE